MRSKQAGLALRAMFMTLLVASPGCDTRASDFCDKVCDCTGCSDSERDSCVQTAGQEKECSAEYDAYSSCVIREASCVEGRPDLIPCEAQIVAYRECTGMNVCEQAIGMELGLAEQCGVHINIGPGNTDSCDEAKGRHDLCVAFCDSVMSCDCLGFGDPGLCAPKALDFYSDCVAACP